MTRVFSGFCLFRQTTKLFFRNAKYITLKAEKLFEIILARIAKAKIVVDATAEVSAPEVGEAEVGAAVVSEAEVGAPVVREAEVGAPVVGEADVGAPVVGEA